MVKINNGSIFFRNGRECIRKGFVCQVEDASKFSAKCRRLGESETRILEKLIRCFNYATGWGSGCKRPPVFEPDSGPHIRDAVDLVIKEDRYFRRI